VLATGDGMAAQEEVVVVTGEGGTEVVPDERPWKERLPVIWIIGFCIFLIGNVLDFLALGIAPQSVVTLVGSWALVVNALAARVVVGEKLIATDIAAVVSIIAGILCTVFGSDRNPAPWTLDQLILQYRKPSVEAMLWTLGMVIITIILVLRWDYHKRRAYAKKHDVALPHPSRVISMLYCIVAALVATNTVLFGKAFGELLFPSLLGDNKFTDVFTVLIVACFLVSLPSQLVLINLSLSVNDVLFHTPNFYVMWNLGSVLTGAVFYEETKTFGVLNWILFPLGAVILFFGVGLVNVALWQKMNMAREEVCAPRASLDCLAPSVFFALRSRCMPRKSA